MDNNDTIDFLAPDRILESRSKCVAGGDAMAKAKSALTCGCPVAAFQKMISGKYKLRIVWDLKDAQAVWRDQNRPAQRFGRQFGNRASRALPRIEGADRVGADRPQGLRRRSPQGRVSPDPQGQEFCSGHCRDPRLGRAPPRASRLRRARNRNGGGITASWSASSAPGDTAC